MSDFKSKLPDFKDITAMANKFFRDMKVSVQEIVQDYREKKAQEEEESKVENSNVEKKDKKDI